MGIDHPGITLEIPHMKIESWAPTIEGDVENKLKLDWRQFTALPYAESVSDFRCVEGWSVPDCRWGGVLFKNLVQTVKPYEQAKYVWFESADGYTTSRSRCLEKR